MLDSLQDVQLMEKFNATVYSIVKQFSVVKNNKATNLSNQISSATTTTTASTAPANNRFNEINSAIKNNDKKQLDAEIIW